MKPTNSIARLLILALLLGLLAGCGDTATRREDDRPGSSEVTSPTGAETPTPTAKPGDPTPTAEASVTPSPTGEVTPTDAPTPTPAPPTPTPGPDYSNFDLSGIWYCKELGALESDMSLCKSDPQKDYRLKIYDKYLEYSHSSDRINMDTDMYELRTEFAEEEMKMYKQWGYGMDGYAANPTDPAKGHYVYSCTTGSAEGALFIIDVLADDTLQTLLCYVMDNGSFPVFVDGFYTMEPVYPTGTYLEDFTGTWHCQSLAPFYEDAWDLTGSSAPFRMDLVIYEDRRLDFLSTNDDLATGEAHHYTLRTTEFTEQEIARYKKWDADGILVWEERMDGEAAPAAMKGTNLLEGRLIYLCDEPGFEGEMLVLTWNKEFKQLDMNLYGYDSESSRECMEYLTFKREPVRKVNPGETYESYIGTWKLTEFRRAGETEMTYCNASEGYAPLEITFDQTGDFLIAREVFSDRSVRYALRTEAKASDPAWYADIDAAGMVTSFANQRLVLVCTDASYYPGALLIITRNPNGTINARFYGKNAGGNVLDRPYNVFERVNGLGRTDDPNFKP
ncbi:MAG: hypothetical protein J5531_01485 [Lachnospiraceae bacterium]|nr:hypothetical protein [Lachnospiraceae bacterium]